MVRAPCYLEDGVFFLAQPLFYILQEYLSMAAVAHNSLF